MAIWKRKKKKEETEDNIQNEEIKETSVDDVSSVTAVETPPAEEQSKEDYFASEKSPEFESLSEAKANTSGGVVLYGRKLSGVFGKGFWGVLSILIMPPVLVFAFGILFIIFMLVFPLLAVVLVAAVPVVFVTLAVFLIALPVIFPLLVVFLLITGKGRLLIGSEGKWFGLEMFGKSYTLK